ncbi:hypothetical protein EW146_g5989 [Bondarzewia mesenterica]|uniref:Uncharacterized protein n=1 Tax=Bondarzewia mesenterica TaxID=1095465 RepID=A0A4S4LRQ0_9AGAM|nr:hypothetical protein EW146_g5989 [Bondarzewia mesenterica]
MSGVSGMSMGPMGGMPESQMPMGMNGMPNVPPQMAGAEFQQHQRRAMRPPPRLPTEEDLQNATKYIESYTEGWKKSRNLDDFPSQHVPKEGLFIYNQVLDKLIQAIEDLEPNLPMYHAVVKNELAIHKLLVICITAQYQHQQCSKAHPRFIFNLNMLRGLLMQVQNAHQGFGQVLSALGAGARPDGGGRPPPPSAPQQQLQPLPPQPIPPPASAPARQVPISPPANWRKPQQAQALVSDAAASTPTPPPVSTPTAQAATPSIPTASPQTPKSPKNNYTPVKPKPTASSVSE